MGGRGDGRAPVYDALKMNKTERLNIRRESGGGTKIHHSRPEREPHRRDEYTHTHTHINIHIYIHICMYIFIQA